jgi:2-polyprenyl-3-methyl-5-hydroxy-6-metoxy-1,4-benzoquinol methylase
LDEPENYFHPSALISILKKLEKLNVGQMWIATHSIPLISYFNEECTLHFVENGKIRFAGRAPENILEGLMGGVDQLDKLHHFLGLPALYANIQYAYECLCPPGVIGPDTTDPQTNQIRRVLSNINPDGMLKVLDFGAGKGRLLATLRDGFNITEKDVSNRYDYIAYDIDNGDMNSCIKEIETVYGSSKNRYFNDENKLLEFHRESIDIIVMCNVLHEIDPLEWSDLLNPENFLLKSLKPNGYLLVVEDTEMWVGEKAYSNGFIVLKTEHLKTLFKIEDGEELFIDDARGNGKLLAHLIHKNNLVNISKESIEETLGNLKKDSLKIVREIRKGTPNYQSGKKHAFYLQQFANAQLVLEDLSAKGIEEMPIKSSQQT